MFSLGSAGECVMRCKKRSWSGLSGWLALGIAILGANQVRSEDLAVSGDEPRLRPLHAATQIGARSDYSEMRDNATRRDALVLKTYVSPASSERSFSPGLLIEGRFLDDGRHT